MIQAVLIPFHQSSRNVSSSSFDSRSSVDPNQTGWSLYLRAVSELWVSRTRYVLTPEYQEPSDTPLPLNPHVIGLLTPAFTLPSQILHCYF